MNNGGDRGTDHHTETCFFEILPDHGLFRGLAGLQPTTGKLPQSAPDILGQALLDKQPPRMRQDARRHLNQDGLLAIASYRPVGGSPP